MPSKATSQAQVLLRQVCQQVGIRPHELLVGAYIQENTSAALAFSVGGVTLKDRLRSELGIAQILPDSMAVTVMDFLKKLYPGPDGVEVGVSSRLQFLLAKDTRSIADSILQQWRKDEGSEAVAISRADGIGVGRALAEGRLDNFECPAGKLGELLPVPRSTKSVLELFTKPELQSSFPKLLTTAWSSLPASELEGLALLAAPRAPWVRKRLAQSQDVSVLKMAVLENYNASPEEVVSAIQVIHSTNPDQTLAFSLFQKAMTRPDVASFLRYQSSQAQSEPAGPAAQFMLDLTAIKGLESPAMVISEHLQQYDAKLAAAAKQRKEQAALFKSMDDLLLAQRVLFDAMYVEECNRGRFGLLAGPMQDIPPCNCYSLSTDPGFFESVSNACATLGTVIREFIFGRGVEASEPAEQDEENIPFFKAKQEALAAVEQSLVSEQEQEGPQQ